MMYPTNSLVWNSSSIYRMLLIIVASQMLIRQTVLYFVSLGPKVPNLQPKAALHSSPQELEEWARSGLYLLVN
jgi:hypothetical protein